ncbi:hypothetical protein ACI78Q_12685 [Geodermatophilus sp. SYSU D00705]
MTSSNPTSQGPPRPSCGRPAVGAAAQQRAPLPASPAATATIASLFGRLPRSSVVLQLLVLLAVQPVLVLSTSALEGAGPLAGLLVLVLLDALVLARASTFLIAHVAECCMRLGAILTAVLGFLMVWASTPPVSWTATALLGATAVMSLLVRRDPRLAGRLPATPTFVGVVAVPVVLCLTGSLMVTF